MYKSLQDFVGLQCLTFKFIAHEGNHDVFALGIDDTLFHFRRKAKLCPSSERSWRWGGGWRRTGFEPQHAYQPPTYSEWLANVGRDHGHDCKVSQLQSIEQIVAPIAMGFVRQFEHLVTFHLHTDWLPPGNSTIYTSRILYGVSEESDLTIVEIGDTQERGHERFVFNFDLAGIKDPIVKR